MKYYNISLFKDGQLVGEGSCQGNNAIEAFENGVADGAVFLPEGQEVDVLAMNHHGLGIRFSATRI